ncbi:hypothetical protein LPB72_01090 [Hydrogenophaga crassostreae]|uniref:YHYH domain-containing protein n=1 Tax=Hydrogenophaga crassostreae TaxID=1763535 RepID=A0A162SYI0_9BURK|nr:YHYH protein [Hydrogenophaga crassostreae]AOW15678.1 hypothetical protein LPB072_14725 [Hydrogenophaga crassostreae]OAD44133.1 hypothetical protein LPB72_01090 [Hydrogenophaga crassostreae]
MYSFIPPSLLASRNLGVVAIALGALALTACSMDGPPGGIGGFPPPPETSSAPARVISSGSTQGIGCDYSYSALNPSASVKAVSEARWTCSTTQRILSANGVPDHEVGTFPNPGNPNRIKAQQVSARFTLSPSLTDRATRLGGPAGVIGLLLNGVKIDAGTNGGCSDTGVCDPGRPAGAWRMEALGQSSFDFGVDNNNAHVQPGGAYHYHGMPEAFAAQQGKGKAMTLIGWAADGFPIYARFGYSVANDAQSSIKVIEGSYRLKATPDANRPPVSVYPMGAFEQDHEYVAGLGDLDECNGRTGATPEFPEGIYHYFATDTYPYFQRCVKGQVIVAARPSRPS